MDSDRKREIDAEVRCRLESGDVDGATSVALRAYSPEIFEFVAALHRNDTDASEVFSLFAEKFWRNLKSFRWDACNKKTMRNASSDKQTSSRTSMHFRQRKAGLQMTRNPRPAQSSCRVTQARCRSSACGCSDVASLRLGQVHTKPRPSLVTPLATNRPPMRLDDVPRDR